MTALRLLAARTSFVLTLFLPVAAVPAFAANYYVRSDGSDASCNGKSDAAAAAAPNCAFATIGKAIESTACGDTAYVRGGTYVDRAKSLNKSCTSAAPWNLVGDGSGRVTWHIGSAARLSGCRLQTGSSKVYRCAIPAPGLTALPSNKGYNGYACMSQKLTNELPIVAPGNTRKDVTGYMCLTPHSSTANLETTPGTWAISGSEYLVHLWNDANPATDAVHPPTESARNDAGSSCLGVSGNFQTVRGLTIADGCGEALYMTGDDNSFTDVTIYNGDIFIEETSARFTLTDFTVALPLRRAFDATLAATDSDAWDHKTSQAGVIQGTDFTITNAEFYGAREGLGFSGGPGKIDRLKVHFNYNHNFKLSGGAKNLEFYNSWFYNSGGGGSSEVVFVEGCVDGVTFSNCTFTEAINIHASEGANCSWGDGPRNFNVYNSVVNEVYWLTTFGDPRAGRRGHDFDYNTYLNNFRSPGNQVLHSHQGRSTLRSLAAWQGYSADTCTDCVRDPNSRESTKEAEFVTWGYKDERTPPAFDFHLKPTAVSVNRGSTAYDPPSGKDLDGVARDATPDIGAYERAAAADTTAPAPVTAVSSGPGDAQVTLRWTHSSSPDAAGARVRFKTTGYPTAPTDGTLACEQAGAPSSSGSCVHSGLPNGTPNYYAVFAYDGAGNYGTGVNTTATPGASAANAAPPAVTNNRRSDLK